MSTSLELLRTLVTFADSPTIAQAARRLGLTQPAVSVQLKRLQDELPHPLFAQEGKRKVLTHYGRALAEELRVKLGQIGRSVESVNRVYADPSALRLRVGVRTELFASVASYISFPGMVEFVGMSNQQSIEGLLSHTIDIAVTHQRPNVASIYATKLFANAARLVVHRKWLEGRKPTLARSTEFLSRTPFLAYKEDPPFIGAWLAHASDGKLGPRDLRVIRICEDWRAIMSFVEGGLGYTIMPEGISTASPDVLFIEIPREIVPEVVFFALYHEELKKLPAMMKFLKL